MPALVPSTVTPIRARIDGGNLVTHEAGSPAATSMYQALNGISAKLGRMDSYGWRDAGRRPTPRDFDRAMLEAYRNGITPIILLEYEGSYQTLSPPPPVGSSAD